MPIYLFDGSQIMYPNLVIGIFNLIVLLFCLAFLARDKFHLCKTWKQQRSATEHPKASMMLAMLFGIPKFCYGGYKVAFS